MDREAIDHELSGSYYQNFISFRSTWSVQNTLFIVISFNTRKFSLGIVKKSLSHQVLAL